ncbi:MAG: inorganic pyrophosphatase [Bacteroidota bacterium]
MSKSFSTFMLHPWHGIDVHEKSPETVNAFIEIVPSDTVKYEIDKKSGILKVDRPQKFSNVVPALYGFIPKTYCGNEVAKHCMKKTKKKNIKGDGDPLDICVLSERVIPHGNIIVQAIPVGGLRMIDKNEADDKIIAVMKDDAVYGQITDISQLPEMLVKRLQHYFLTYKNMPGEKNRIVEITHTYTAKEAKEIIGCSLEDYRKMVKEGK